jgi:hypothetical protein
LGEFSKHMPIIEKGLSTIVSRKRTTADSAPNHTGIDSIPPL